MPIKDLLQWLGIAIELAGIALIVIEPYAPRSSNLVSGAVEGIGKENSISNRKGKGWRGVGGITSVYVTAWILGSTWDPALNLHFNVAMTIFSSLFWFVVLIIDRFLKLSVFVGRGNTIGGIGLVLAIIALGLVIASML